MKNPMNAIRVFMTLLPYIALKCKSLIGEVFLSYLDFGAKISVEKYEEKRLKNF